MSGRYLLDTNIVIALFASDASILDHLFKAAEIFVPSTVIGELCYGAYKSTKARENLARLDRFAANCTVVACDGGTARQYGEVKFKLRQSGRPIPENDIWIAAMAFQHHLTLVSRDEHFQAVAGLEVELW